MAYIVCNSNVVNELRGIKCLIYGYFFVLKKWLLKNMVEYSPINVLPKDLASTLFDKDLKCFKYLKLQYM